MKSSGLIRTLSLGWGRQSFALAAMAALGELEPLDFAISADTTHEQIGTYKFARQMTPWLEEHGVKVVTVYARDMFVISHDGVAIPAHTMHGKTKAMIQKHCTSDWKVGPIRRYYHSKRQGQMIEQWLGITTDEFQRIKDSDVSYIQNRYPLIEKEMTRQDCVDWLEEHDLPVPPKSSCTFCPFHDSTYWKELIENKGPDWDEAVEVDESIRNALPKYELFVHRSMKPLRELDPNSLNGAKQLDLWNEECSGMCGV